MRTFNLIRYSVLSFIVLVCISIAGASGAAEAKKAAPGPEPANYAVNLADYSKPVDPSTIAVPEGAGGQRLYVRELKTNGKTVWSLRLGFFDTKKMAEKAATALRKSYINANVVKVTKEEVAASEKLAIAPRKKAQKAEAQAEKKESKAEPALDAEMSAAMEQAEAAVKKGDYPAAIALYLKVLKAPPNKHQQDAQELLGLARERNGEAEQARGEYITYLILYPKGEGAERVRQRLEGLVTASAAPAAELKKPAEERRSTELYGSFSQYYNRDESYTDAAGNTVNRSALSTDLDVYLRRRGGSYDMKAAFTGGYELDFLTSSESKTRLSQLYLDLSDKKRKASGRFGRQTQTTGGVLGRFDGVHLGYQLTGSVRANLVGGFPVDTTALENYNPDRYFYGVNFDLGTFAERWDFNTFFINQVADGMTDRRAVGGEARYFHPERSFFSLVDYDIEYNELNTVLLVGNLILKDMTVVNVSADYRNSPIILTTNALQGQTASTLTELLSTYTESEIKDLARDRTAKSKSLTVGVSKPLNDKYQVSGDFTVTELEGTPASGGVDEIAGTGLEYFYSLQLIGNSLIKEGDTAILGLRYTDAASADTVSVSLNSRYPVNHEWRINPRIRVDYSDRNQTVGRLVKIVPSLRTDYYWMRKLNLEFEGGLEWIYEWLADTTETTRNYFIIAGYRYDF